LSKVAAKGEIFERGKRGKEPVVDWIKGERPSRLGVKDEVFEMRKSPVGDFFESADEVVLRFRRFDEFEGLEVGTGAEKVGETREIEIRQNVLNIDLERRDDESEIGSVFE
jgi:hypothetical protein